MAAPDNEPVFVDPNPQEYYDSVDRFQRDVIDRASEIPKDELEKLMEAERKRRWPYMRRESDAMMAYIAALAGLDPKEFKKPAKFDGCLSKYFGPGCDSLEMVRAVRGTAV